MAQTQRNDAWKFQTLEIFGLNPEIYGSALETITYLRRKYSSGILQQFKVGFFFFHFLAALFFTLFHR